MFKTDLLEKFTRADLIPIIKRIAGFVGYWIIDSESKQYAMEGVKAFKS